MDRLKATSASLPGGGGAFALSHLTVGIFGTAQPTHRLAVGTDRSAILPLERHQGWILPAGSEGLCEYDDPLDVTMVEVPGQLLQESGLAEPDAIAPVVGTLDPVIYFPRDDIEMAFLEPSDHRTTCPHKGEASYFSIAAKSGLIENAAWSYEDPKADVDRIRDHLAFYTDKAAVERL